MNPSDIRAELEQLADNKATYADYLRLAKAWQAVKDTTPESYHAVIEDRLRALEVSTLMPALSEVCS